MGKKNDKKNIYVEITSKSKDWIFISESTPLFLIIEDQHGNSEMTELPAIWDRKEKIIKESYRVVVQETMTYKCTKETLKKIASAKSAKIKIVGKDIYLVRHFHPVNQKYLSMFLNEPFMEGVL